MSACFDQILAVQTSDKALWQLSDAHGSVTVIPCFVVERMVGIRRAIHCCEFRLVQPAPAIKGEKTGS